MTPRYVSIRSSTLALAIAWCFSPVPGVADITSSGAVNPAVGPGNTDLGNVSLQVGNAAAGQMSLSGGTLLRIGDLSVGTGGTGNGTVTASGAGTRIELIGDGFDVINRFNLGSWGVGSLTLASGAVLDGTLNAASCLLPDHHCHAFVGNAAGSDGTFTLTGSGTRASFLRSFNVGNISVFRPPVDNFTYGTPGGTTRGTVNILDGAVLDTEAAFLGSAPGGSSPTGRERSFADVLISGPNSAWNVKAGSLEPNEASMYVARHANSWATIRIENGGTLNFEAPPNFINGLRLTQNDGRSDMVVTGVGSAVNFNGGLLQVGRRLGTANLDVLAGARLNDLYHVSVGRDGSTAHMTIDGAGSVVSIDKTGNVGTTDAGIAPGIIIGRNGTGTVTVSSGGRLDIVNVAAPTPGAPYLRLGDQPGSSGTLNIVGANSVVSISSQSIFPGGGANEARNPLVSIGDDGRGTLNITAGGKLLVQGNAVSTPANTRSAVVNIGGFNDTQPGGNGIALIDGLGSELRVSGSDRSILIGRGPGSTGQLTVSNQGLASSTIFAVGRAGTGVLRVDNARIEVNGQQAGGTQSGASFSVGSDGGVGSATFTNASRLEVTNLGSAGATVSVGGTGNNPTGDGTLTLRSGSQIAITANPGQATMQVGRDGSGLVRLREGSSVSVANGNVYVGRFAGSDGTMILTDSSSLTTSYLGVGRNKTGNGGTGTVVVSSSSTLTAGTIEIGTNGFLGGNGTIVGAVTNYGIVSPGNSPGTLKIDGSFINAAGGRIVLEVESDGAGGFNTDRLIFAEGTSIDLAGLDIRFQFLGATDPNAFQASGKFDIDTFLVQETAGGTSTIALDPTEYTGVTFTARADRFVFQSFAYDVQSGASFVAAPVPEPSQWALMLAGMGIAAGLARRRSRPQRVPA